MPKPPRQEATSAATPPADHCCLDSVSTSPLISVIASIGSIASVFCAPTMVISQLLQCGIQGALTGYLVIYNDDPGAPTPSAPGVLLICDPFAV